MRTDLDPGWRPIHRAFGLKESGVCCSRAISSSSAVFVLFTFVVAAPDIDLFEIDLQGR
ncbi:hypothetical protein ACVWXO_005383 [Bradyrhizobium sp. LM2.7]